MEDPNPADERLEPASQGAKTKWGRPRRIVPVTPTSTVDDVPSTSIAGQSATIASRVKEQAATCSQPLGEARLPASSVATTVVSTPSRAAYNRCKHPIEGCFSNQESLHVRICMGSRLSDTLDIDVEFFYNIPSATPPATGQTSAAHSRAPSAAPSAASRQEVAPTGGDGGPQEEVRSTACRSSPVPSAVVQANCKRWQLMADTLDSVSRLFGVHGEEHAKAANMRHVAALTQMENKVRSATHSIRSTHTSVVVGSPRCSVASGTYLDPAPGPEPRTRSNNEIHGSHRSSISTASTASGHTAASGASRHTEVSGASCHIEASGASHHTEASGASCHTVASGGSRHTVSRGSRRTVVSATSRPAGMAEVASPAAVSAAALPPEATVRLASVVVSGEKVHQLHDIPQALLDRCQPAFTPSWCKPDPPLPFQKKAPVFEPLAAQPALDFLPALKEYVEHYGFTEKAFLSKVLPHVLVGAAKDWLTFPIKDLRTWASFQRHFLAYTTPRISACK